MNSIRIIMFLFPFSCCLAQPGYKSNTIVNIQSINIMSKQVFKKGDSSIWNNMIYLVDKKGRNEVWTNTVSKLEEKYDCFIYNKDTMRVKVILRKYYNLEGITIKKFNFIKGNYTIDLLKFIENTDNIEYGNLIINNFPEDCLPYRKGEKE